MNVKKFSFFIPFLFSTLFLCAGCTPKPTNSEIEAAIKMQLQNNVPVSWVGNLMGGKNARINSIEIHF